MRCRYRRKVFLDGLRLAGQRGFLGAEIRRGDEPTIRRHDVPRFQEHQVADHEVMRRDVQCVSVATHSDAGNGQLFQRGNRPLRSEVLLKANHGIQHDDGQNRDGVLEVPEGGRDDRSDDEDQDHRRGDLLPHDGPRASCRAFDQFVWPVRGEPSRGFRRRQAPFRVCAELRCHDRRVDFVPGLHSGT